MTEGRQPDFGSRAQTYDTLRPTDRPWWERFTALVELADLRGRRVLDVGCGTGRLAAALATEARAKVWAIDASAEMVAVARETVPAGVGVRVGDAGRLPFRDGWFDRVTMSLVIHLVDQPAAFAEACRVLATDGRIGISTFHPNHFQTYWLNPYFPSIRAVDEERFPSEAQLRIGLEAAGFARVEVTRLISETSLQRDEALARIAGRHISTFDLLPAAELVDGSARAERELPASVVVLLDQLLVVGFKS